VAPSLASRVRVDLERLHAAWMDLAFPRQRDPHPVEGRPRPSTRLGRAAYRVWTALGLLALVVGYPLAVVGVVVRHQGRRLAAAADALGLAGLLVGSALVWAALTVVVARRPVPAAGVVAVAAGGGVAAVSAVLAAVAARVGGRPTTALVAAPLAVTAVFLPPAVAALYSPAVARVVLPTSDVLAVWMLDGPLSVAGVGATLRARFDLVGLAYVGMWFGLAVPVGWGLGGLVALADVVRRPDAE
jgi:hypothetical protein